MNNLITHSWPPVYKLKRHRRAKNVKLHASETYGLEITLPTRFSLKHLPEILEEHKEWILAKLGRRVHVSFTLPKKIHFHALNQTWFIHYEYAEEQLKIKKIFDQTILLRGDIENKNAVQHKLLSWIKKEARHFLETRLYLISQRTGLSYQAVSIRRQKTLWGSCTVNKHINLNLKLIFLPLMLVDYILIHELCHTKHLNHSKHFWQLVEKHDPNYHEHRQRMHTADEFIPLELFI